jgi:hypothetical protein
MSSNPMGITFPRGTDPGVGDMPEMMGAKHRLSVEHSDDAGLPSDISVSQLESRHSPPRVSGYLNYGGRSSRLRFISDKNGL